MLFCAGSALPWTGLLDGDQVGDTPGYERYGEAILDGEVPYRDFYVEYPPGALPVFVLPALGGPSDYATRFKVLAVALGLALVACVVAGLEAAGASPRRLGAAAALVGVAPAALGPVFLINYDVWPALLATAAVVTAARGRPAFGGALLGVAVAAKLYALVLAPLLFVHLLGRGARRAAYAFALALAAVVAPFALVAPGALGNNLLDLARRPLQIESLGSSLLLTAHRLSLYEPTVNSDFNSQNLGGPLADALAAAGSILAGAFVVAVVAMLVRRRGGIDSLYVAAAAAVVAVVAFGKILSPQFLVWLVPLVALVPSVAAYALLLAALVLTHAWFPSRYGDLVALGDVSWVVLARNVALVALLAALLSRLPRRAER